MHTYHGICETQVNLLLRPGFQTQKHLITHTHTTHTRARENIPKSWGRVGLNSEVLWSHTFYYMLHGIFRAKMMARLVKCLFHNHEDPGSNPQHPWKQSWGNGTEGSLGLAGLSPPKSVCPRLSERLSQNTLRSVTKEKHSMETLWNPRT